MRCWSGRFQRLGAARHSVHHNTHQHAISLQFAPESTDNFHVIQSFTLCRVNQGAKHCQDKRKSLFFTAISTCTTHSQVPPAAPLSLTAPVRLFKIVLLPVLTSLPQTLLGELILCLVFVDINRSRHLCGA
jgi:hypothetical protein